MSFLLFCFILDDIQGTGCVVLAGLLSALEAQGKKATSLKDQRILVVGAGSAGLGVSDMVAKGMMQQGLTEDEARARFYVCDKVHPHHSSYMTNIQITNFWSPFFLVLTLKTVLFALISCYITPTLSYTIYGHRMDWWAFIAPTWTPTHSPSLVGMMA